MIKSLEATFRKNLRGTSAGNYLKNSWMLKYYQQSAGNPFFPILSLFWKISKLLSRRREVKINGIQFSLPCNNWITHFRWYLFHSKEIEVREYIDRYVKNGDVFFDIGANIGLFSIYAAKKYPNITVYSFEPEFSNLALLKENIVQNKLTKQVFAYGLGISDFTGLSKLHIQDFDEGAAAHTENKLEITKTDEGYKPVWAEGIACYKLDDLLKEIEIYPNVMKIDTDGNEAKILTGAEKILAHPQFRSLVIEMPHGQGSKSNICETLLQKHGFELVWSKKGDTLNEVWEKIKS